jgi:hypothetical protein
MPKLPETQSGSAVPDQKMQGIKDQSPPIRLRWFNAKWKAAKQKKIDMSIRVAGRERNTTRSVVRRKEMDYCFSRFWIPSGCLIFLSFIDP